MENVIDILGKTINRKLHLAKVSHDYSMVQTFFHQAFGALDFAMETINNWDEEAELILMRIGTDEAGEYMDIVDDDEELLTVGKVFEERLRAMYDIDDDDVEGQPS